MSKKSAFTFVEMSAVIVVIVLISAIVTPRLIAEREAAARKAFEYELVALVTEGLNRSKISEEIIRFRGTETNFQITTEASGTSLSDGGGLRSVTVPTGVTVSRVLDRGEEIGLEEFEVVFGKVGSLSPSSIEFRFNGRVKTFDIKSDGRALWRTTLADEEQQATWEAGDLEQRTG